VERKDDTTVVMTSEDPLQLFRTFITTVVLTRAIAE
jgi:hypothetical protein